MPLLMMNRMVLTRNFRIRSRLSRGQINSVYTKTVPDFKLQSIGIKQTRFDVKHESFIFRSLFGELDSDYLIYPNLVSSAPETQILSSQYEMIRENFHHFVTNPEQLEQLGFWNLHHFSEVEKVFLFEAIGRSLNHQKTIKRPPSNISENNLLVLDRKITVTDRFLASYEDNKRLMKQILSLITHNSLVLNTLLFSDNPNIQKRSESLQNAKISFAFDEPSETFTTATHPFWTTTAKFHPDTNTWTLNGTKSRIIDNNCDEFLVFCRTKNDVDSSTDCGIASFLVHKNQVLVEDDGTDNHGFKYVKITFKDLVLSQEKSLVLVDETSRKILNIRSTGQLMVAAIQLGLMKEMLHNIVQVFKSKPPNYRHLTEHLLATITERIYGLESMLYLTASHFDSFELGQVDLFLQALAIKIMATEYAADTIADARFLFDSKRLNLIVSNDIGDVLNVLDSFLGSCTWNRMLLATYGLRAIGRWKFDHIVKTKLPRIYYGHFLKTTIGFWRRKIERRFDGAENDLQALDRMDGALKDCSKHLKKTLEIEYEMGQHILRLYGRECVKYQIDLNRFASIMMSPFQMVAAISRTNGDLARAVHGSKLQMDLCRKICEKESKRADSLHQLIYGVLDTSEERRSKPVHTANIRYDGYFARPTFDRVI